MKATDQIFASLMFFTRLPWWRLREVPSEAFKHTVDFWPLVGWITGGGMALSFVLYTQIMPLSVAIILAIATRLLLTGALHEDGLADFCDGMGGGTTRERILTIMKDSNIGTYGVLGLIIYFMLIYNTLSNLGIASTLSSAKPLWHFAATILFADVYAKSIASFIIILPYARNEESSKAHVIYQKRTKRDTFLHILRIMLSLSLPIGLMLYAHAPLHIVPLLVPILIFIPLMFWMKKKLDGYTGDCCGACFLICELTFLLAQLVSVS